MNAIERAAIRDSSHAIVSSESISRPRNGSSTDAAPAVSKEVTAEFEKALTSAKEGSSAARHRLAVKRVIRSTSWTWMWSSSSNSPFTCARKMDEKAK